uniref:Stage III sporulation protein AF n=1 Tax=Heterorhabditis bacteriophora TaxID=37862 RepID=A0A1I7X031_HETBA
MRCNWEKIQLLRKLLIEMVVVLIISYLLRTLIVRTEKRQKNKMRYHFETHCTMLEYKERHLTYYSDITLEGSSKNNEKRIEKISNYNPVITHRSEDELIAEIKRFIVKNFNFLIFEFI